MQNVQSVPDWLPLSAKDACLGDPVCELTTIPKAHPSIAVLIGWGVFGLGVTIFTFAVGLLGPLPGPGILPATDLRFIGAWLAAVTVYVSFVWIWCTWHPRATATIFHKLRDGDYLGPARTGITITWLDRQVRGVAKALLPASPRRQLLVFTAIILSTIVGTYAASWDPVHPCMSHPYCFDQKGTFLTENRFFFLVWNFVATFQVVVVTSIGIRQMFVAAAFSDLFRTREIKLQPFHPDNCCGMAFVGNYMLKAAMIPVTIGFWVIFLMFYPVWVGSEPWMFGLAWFYAIGYLLFPIAFFMPAWSLHHAMEKARNSDLERLARNTYDATQPVMAGTQRASAELVEQVQLYESLERAYTTIPFPRRRSMVFLVTYLVPIISVVLPLILG
jgi:hypothetical protein